MVFFTKLYLFLHSAAGLEDRLSRNDNPDGKLGLWFDDFLQSYHAFFKLFARANRHPTKSSKTTLNNELFYYEGKKMHAEEYERMKMRLAELESILYKKEANVDHTKTYKKNLKLRKEPADVKYRLGSQNKIRLAWVLSIMFTKLEPHFWK